MNRPAIGSVVEVTTKWRSYWYFRTSDYEFHTDRGEVLEHDPDRIPGTIRIACGGWMKTCIIPMHRVTAIKYLKGKEAKEQKVANKTIKVKGSKGDTYIVSKSGNTYSCTCVGFQFRRKCRHLELLK